MIDVVSKGENNNVMTKNAKNCSPSFVEFFLLALLLVVHETTPSDTRNDLTPLHYPLDSTWYFFTVEWQQQYIVL